MLEVAMKSWFRSVQCSLLKTTVK